MAKEIERKFLVKGEFKHLAVRKIEITQGYLSIDNERIIRLRLCDERAYLTIKAPAESTMFTRDEWEYEIPFSEASEMLKLCLPGRILKTRYIVPFKITLRGGCVSWQA